MKICVFARPVHNSIFPLVPAPGGPLSACGGYTPIPNPMDEVALEMALSLREALGPTASTVTLCSAGEQAACESVLRELLACGADGAIWIPDSAGEPDGERVARNLRAAFRAQRFDLALFGFYDSDTEAGEVGPMFGVLSGIPYLGPAADIRPAGTHGLEVTLKEGRLREKVRVQTPVSIGVLRGKPLRYPSYRGRSMAARARIRCVEAPSYEPRVQRVKIAGSKPRRTGGQGLEPQADSADRIRQALGVSAPRAGDGNRIEGTPEQAARRILHVLERENLWVPGDTPGGRRSG